jgi:hypothetical protein
MIWFDSVNALANNHSKNQGPALCSLCYFSCKSTSQGLVQHSLYPCPGLCVMQEWHGTIATAKTDYVFDSNRERSRVNQVVMISMQYFQLKEDSELPSIGHFAPFKVVLAIEDDVSRARQLEVANWMIAEGGRYVMICGENCAGWQQAIRQANLELYDIEDMNPADFVMITSHAHERLRSVFWHARKHANHPNVRFDQVITIHLGQRNRSVEYLAMFDKA